MNILTLNSTDRGGGAAEVARRLSDCYRVQGHGSVMAVGIRRGDDTGVVELPDRNPLRDAVKPLQGLLRGAGRLHEALHCLGRPRRLLDRKRGIEDWNLPSSHKVLELAPFTPDVVHAHNLHSFRGPYGHFDLNALIDLGLRAPMVITMHDAWLTTGHCAFPTDCGRWRGGCGECPDLDRYPPLRRDSTAENWRRKKEVFANSRLFIASPCKWLLDRVGDSMLAEGMVEGRVINNGLDLKVFRPGDRDQARTELGLPKDAQIVLYAAQGAKDGSRKDFPLLKKAVTRAAGKLDGRLIFIGLGEDAPPETSGEAELRFVPYQNDHRTVVLYYQACDLFIHASKAETFPNTIIEAMACGKPVIANSVGGTKEQVSERTGRLVPVGDVQAMAAGIAELLSDGDGLERLGRAAAKEARQRFDLDKQAEAYISWFKYIVESFER